METKLDTSRYSKDDNRPLPLGKHKKIRNGEKWTWWRNHTESNTKSYKISLAKVQRSL